MSKCYASLVIKSSIHRWRLHTLLVEEGNMLSFYFLFSYFPWTRFSGAYSSRISELKASDGWADVTSPKVDNIGSQISFNR
ncbi:hypothetical protein O9929_02315 [Vibrio lentus]|nr:hypothetical protein [Vibrio lentus]